MNLIEFMQENRIEKKHMDKYICKDNYYRNLKNWLKNWRKQRKWTIQKFYKMCVELKIDVTLDKIEEIFNNSREI